MTFHIVLHCKKNSYIPWESSTKNNENLAFRHLQFDMNNLFGI